MTGTAPATSAAISRACCCRVSACSARKAAAASISVWMRGAMPASAGDLGGDDQHVGDRGARLEDPRQADHRHVGLARPVDQRAADAGDDALRAERLGRLEAGERLLGLARVAGAEDRPLRRRPARQRVAAHGQHRPGQPVAERRRGEVAADRRAAHPADEEPGRRAPPRGAPIRPARARREAGRECRGRRRSSLGRQLSHSRRPSCRQPRAPGSTTAPAARIEPLTRAPSPIVQPSSRTESATSAPASTTQPAETTARGPTRAAVGDRRAGGDEEPRRGRRAPRSPPCLRGCPRSPPGIAPGCRCPSSTRRAASRTAPRRPAAGRPRARSRPRGRAGSGRGPSAPARRRPR